MFYFFFYPSQKYNEDYVVTRVIILIILSDFVVVISFFLIFAVVISHAATANAFHMMSIDLWCIKWQKNKVNDKLKKPKFTKSEFLL